MCTEWVAGLCLLIGVQKKKKKSASSSRHIWDSNRTGISSAQHKIFPQLLARKSGQIIAKEMFGKRKKRDWYGTGRVCRGTGTGQGGCVGGQGGCVGGLVRDREGVQGDREGVQGDWYGTGRVCKGTGRVCKGTGRVCRGTGTGQGGCVRGQGGCVGGLVRDRDGPMLVITRNALQRTFDTKAVGGGGQAWFPKGLSSPLLGGLVFEAWRKVFRKIYEGWSIWDGDAGNLGATR